MVAIVKRDVNGALSAGKQQAFAQRILAHDVRVLVLRNAVCNLSPRRAGVTGPIDVWAQVVEPQRIDGGISHVLVEVAGFEDRNLLPGLKLFWRYFAPMSAAIGRAMNQTIVGAGPDESYIQRRRRDGIDHAPLGRLGGRLRAELADARWDFDRFARQVGSNLIPVLAC